MAEDEIHDFLFVQATHLISFASDWKFNPAGSWLQFKTSDKQPAIRLSNHSLCPVIAAVFQFGQTTYTT